MTLLLTAYAAWAAITGTILWLASYLYRSVRASAALDEKSAEVVAFRLPEPPAQAPSFKEAS